MRADTEGERPSLASFIPSWKVIKAQALYDTLTMNSRMYSQVPCFDSFIPLNYLCCNHYHSCPFYTIPIYYMFYFNSSRLCKKDLAFAQPYIFLSNFKIAGHHLPSRSLSYNYLLRVARVKIISLLVALALARVSAPISNRPDLLTLRNTALFIKLYTK